MRADVLVQNGFLAKLFPTIRLRTPVRPLTAVDAQVLVEDGALPERPGAEHTGERLLVGVDAEMLRQVRLLAELLPAFGTAVGTRVRVDPLVLQER